MDFSLFVKTAWEDPHLPLPPIHTGILYTRVVAGLNLETLKSIYRALDHKGKCIRRSLSRPLAPRLFVSNICCYHIEAAVNNTNYYPPCLAGPSAG